MSNRLQYEDSPYLQQHKENPVDWYPWCDEAFERAENEHKAIFISIGYSSCHWCHVMEHEVFENQTIAEFLNRHFISIKVDREERPDIDKYYQDVHMLLNRRPGGWPTSIFCTPQMKPFFAGTYLPPHSQGHLMGFTELTAVIAEKVAQNDEALFKNADEILSFLQPKGRNTEATVLDDALFERFIKQAKHNFEPTYGGFSVAPKFPHVSTLSALLQLDAFFEDPSLRAMAVDTLSNMAAGGICDLVDGGFCRYSVDTEWLVPHFEKMTYDNGLLCGLYVQAYRRTGETRFLDVAKEIADFMLAFMRRDALFFSASDADSEGEEGKYFVYGYDELIDAIIQSGFDEAEAKRMAMRLGASREGNFEGKNILRFADLRREPWFEQIRPALRALREVRPYPFIDRKVQTSWNAMMIRALFELGRHEPRYHQPAVESLEALLAKMQPGDTLYHSALIDRDPKVEAFLEDYAYLGCALIAAYESTFDERYLIRAQQCANTALATFYEEGRWYFSRGEFVTEAELSDSSYPGSVSLMTDLLQSLGSLVDDKYRRFAFKTFEYHSKDLAKTPIYYPYLTSQMLRYLKEERIVKAPKTLLETDAERLAMLPYPFVRLQAADQNAYLLCGAQSCFATADDAEELERALTQSF